MLLKDKNFIIFDDNVKCEYLLSTHQIQPDVGHQNLILLVLKISFYHKEAVSTFLPVPRKTVTCPIRFWWDSNRPIISPSQYPECGHNGEEQNLWDGLISTSISSFKYLLRQQHKHSTRGDPDIWRSGAGNLRNIEWKLAQEKVRDEWHRK